MILKIMLFYLKINKSEKMVIIENKNKTNKQTKDTDKPCLNGF